jgi:4-hydroxy-3-methylbut-2-en-1-yl diphosphate reductase
LFEQCRQVNSNSIFIHHVNQINPQLLNSHPKSIGICGATSTPEWQLQQVADSINKLLNNVHS